MTDEHAHYPEEACTQCGRIDTGVQDGLCSTCHSKVEEGRLVVDRLRSGFEVGDRVRVMCPGLKMLRDMMPNMPPNHHGTVEQIIGLDGVKEYVVLFDDSQSSAPYTGDLLEDLSDDSPGG